LLRVLCAFVMAIFLAQTTVAWAFPCACFDESGESCPDEDRDKQCPCPLDCGPCCAGSAIPAIPPSFAVFAIPDALSVEIARPLAERAPPPAECFEILRVPKPHRA
jgi:hypothetical protein